MNRTSVICFSTVLVITVIAWVVYSLTVNSQLPFMDFLMVASAVVGSFTVHNRLSKRIIQISNSKH